MHLKNIIGHPIYETLWQFRVRHLRVNLRKTNSSTQKKKRMIEGISDQSACQNDL